MEKQAGSYCLRNPNSKLTYTALYNYLKNVSSFNCSETKKLGLHPVVWIFGIRIRITSMWSDRKAFVSLKS